MWIIINYIDELSEVGNLCRFSDFRLGIKVGTNFTAGGANAAAVKVSFLFSTLHLAPGDSELSQPISFDALLMFPLHSDEYPVVRRPGCDCVVNVPVICYGDRLMLGYTFLMPL